MNMPTTITAASKSPEPDAFAKARKALAELKAAESFWETFEGNPNPPGEDMDITAVVGDAIYSAVFEKRIDLLLAPATCPADVHEKLVEIRIGGLGNGHAYWDDVMMRLEADAAELATKGAAA